MEKKKTLKTSSRRHRKELHEIKLKSRPHASPKRAPQNKAEVAALLTASRAVLEHSDFARIAEALFIACKELVKAAGGFVTLVNTNIDKNEVIFADPPPRASVRDGILAMPMQGPFLEAHQRGAVLRENDIPSSPWGPYIKNIHSDIKNILLAPMVLEGASIGILGLYNKSRGFTKNDALMAAAFGEFAAVGLRNCKTYEALKNSETRLNSVVRAARDAVINVDAEGNIVLWNDAAESMFGYAREEIIGEPFTVILPAQYRKYQQQFFTRAVAAGDTAVSQRSLEIVMQRKDGTMVPAEGSFSLWKIDGRVFVTVIFRDITERKQVQEKIARQHAVLEAMNMVLRESLACETEEDAAATCLKIAEALTGSMFGFVGEINKSGLFDTIALSDPGWDMCRISSTNTVMLINNMEIRGIWGRVLKDAKSCIVNNPGQHPDRIGTPEGHPAITSFLGVPLMERETVTGMIAVANKEAGYDEFDQRALEAMSVAFREVLKRKRAEGEIRKLTEELRALSFMDELTGIYNRRGFITVAERQLKIAKRMERESVLLFIDLDNMKWINDNLGHLEGDKALLLTADILKRTFRDSDIIARVGGDEFVVLAIEAQRRTVPIISRRLQDNLAVCNNKAGRRYQLSFSIGYALYDPRSPCSTDELITQADKAMYEQKRSKKRNI
jgi:diguanylate cyclase (GGDEF)-like protein/PAS domain S-box-containing protein